MMIPLPASMILWVLVNAGESNTHDWVGYLTLYLTLSYACSIPEKPTTVSSPLNNSAYLAAKCLTPIQKIIATCNKRSEYIKGIIKILSPIANESNNKNILLYNLEKIVSKLYGLSQISINPKDFIDAAEKIESLSKEGGFFEQEDSAKCVLEIINNNICKSKDRDWKLSKNVKYIIEKVIDSFLRKISESTQEKEEEKQKVKGLQSDSMKNKLSNNFDEYLEFFCEEIEKIYVINHKIIGQKLALISSIKSFLELNKMANQESNGPIDILNTMSNCYEFIAEEMTKVTNDTVSWCEHAMLRHIGHANAGDMTEFDPSEIISGLLISVSFNRINSPLQITSALKQALKGCRTDGSWTVGQPIAEKYPYILTPPIADLIWMLASTINLRPEVKIADEALFNFVDWLERTRKTIRLQDSHDQSLYSGWVWERSIKQRIDLWVTSFSICALLEIRELMEMRLWQLCKKRFHILTPRKNLSHIDPVDLCQKQSQRLHHRLAKTARLVALQDKKAHYSFILHGPPGTSKTAISEALAAEMWQFHLKEPRLIRITPADFTRQGEDGLDREARIIFDVLCHLRKVTILFDEIDDLLRVRDPKKELRFLDIVVPAMLNRLQDLRDSCPQQEICFILATNFIDNIEPALIRPGRIDETFPIVYPDLESRKRIIQKHTKFRTENGKADYNKAKKRLEMISNSCMPWKELKNLCDEATDCPKLINKLLVEKYLNYHMKVQYDLDRLAKSRELVDEFAHLVYAMSSEQAKRIMESLLKDNKKEPEKVENFCKTIKNNLAYKFGVEHNIYKKIMENIRSMGVKV